MGEIEIRSHETKMIPVIKANKSGGGGGGGGGDEEEGEGAGKPASSDGRVASLQRGTVQSG